MSWVNVLDLLLLCVCESRALRFISLIAPMRPIAMWKLLRGRAKEEEGRRGKMKTQQNDNFMNKQEKLKKKRKEIRERGNRALVIVL